MKVTRKHRSQINRRHRQLRSKFLRVERLEARYALSGMAPVAVNDFFTGVKDTPLVVGSAGVLANDTDAEFDPLTANLFSPPAHGSVTLNADGSFTYTPTAGYTGLDGFLYSASDGASSSKLAAVTLQINATGNIAPVANADSYTIAEDGVLDIGATGGLLTNDTDANGDPLTAVLVEGSGPTHGTLTLLPTGAFHYIPDANFHGVDQFSYKANDGSQDSNPAVVTINVTSVNDAPVAANDSYTTAEDTPLVVANPGVLSNDSDADGDGLTATVFSQPQHGTLTFNASGGFTYNPAPNYNGPDGFSYYVSDGSTNSGIAAVSINVTPVNDPPVAVNDEYTLVEDTQLVVSAPGVLANDTDVENSLLTVSEFHQPAHGTVTVNADGSFTYTPAPDYFGPDSFTYKVSDGLAMSTFAAVTLNVTSVNDAPVANPDSASVAEDSTNNTINVLGNDSKGPANESGQTLTVIAASALNGTVTINGDGTLSYTPNADYSGPDTISYTIQDDGTTDGNPDPLTASSTVAVIVTEVNDAPVANPDEATVAEDSSDNTINVLGNDSKGPANESGQTLTVIAASALNGTVTINGDGTLSYTPNANYNGPDTISYTIQDDGTTDGNPDPLTASSTVAVIVTEVNDPPVANPDEATVAEDSSDNTINVLGNDSKGPANESGQTLTVIAASALNGTVTINGDGTLSYTPNADYNGPDTISYTIQDDGTTDGNPDPLTASSTVAVTVTPVNDPPVGVNDLFVIDEDTTLNIAAPGVLANDFDADGDTLSVAQFIGPVHGTLSLLPDGSISYTPAPGYHGMDGLVYQATDGIANSGWTAVTIIINPVNHAPVAVDDSYSVAANATLNVHSPGVLANDTDADNDGLTATLVTGPEHGNVVLQLNGSFVYQPTAGYTGPDSFVYSASDGFASSQATVNINVTAANDPPVANNDSYSTTAGVPLNIAADGVLGNDTDPNSDPLTAILFPSNPMQPDRTLHGTLTLNSDGSFLYTPDDGFTGSDFFLYSVSDGSLSSAFAAVTIDVEPALELAELLAEGESGGLDDSLLDTLASDPTRPELVA
jgi:VCBS repeat-containing protein